MKLHTLDEMTDMYIGPIGTPKRDAFEEKLAAELHAYHVGEAIRQAELALEDATAITAPASAPEAKDIRVYNLAGQQMKGRRPDGTLPRGIYIVNGKKVLY